MPGGGDVSQKLLIRSNTQSRISLQMKSSKTKSKTHSDSEGSVESNSLSVESSTVKTVKDSSEYYHFFII